ncbi:MAG: hypothetical protein ACM3X2_03805 [Pseudomonadota bacterium]
MRTENARCRRMIAAGVAALMACVVSASPGSAAGKAKPQKSQICASDRDLAALNARVLQTELMVAALSCDERQRYNTFVTTYQQVLAERGQALKALFKRTKGAQANTVLNAFITKLANDASQQVMTRGDEYCVFAGQLFEEAIATPPSDLNSLANKHWITSRHGFRPCVAEAGRKQTG